MEMKPLSAEQEAKLKRPLPPEAVQQHPTKTYLSTIKAIYVIERFNEVFGVGQWQLDSKIVEAREPTASSVVEKVMAGMVVVETALVVPAHGIRLTAFGGNDNPDRGDAYKGAVTDAVTKIGSYLGIGMDVFKGLHDKPKTPASAPRPQTSVSTGRPLPPGYARPYIRKTPTSNQEQYAA